MYFFTGNNLFGQWITCKNNVVDKLRSFSDDKYMQSDSNFSANATNLIHIGWSHNIFHFNNKFFIAGDYKCSGHFLETINLPNECVNSSNLTVVSNDCCLFVVDKNTCTLWVINLENNESIKINIVTEVPLKSDLKRSKMENYILKCKATNESLIFLTSNRLVYCGMIPNLIDTSHCVGEPIDIQCGNEHFMLLTSDGKLYTWGNGRRLQLGHGDVNSLDVPTEVEAIAGIKIIKISAGGWHSLALSEFGDLYAWGWNDTGQLGIQENSNNETNKSYALPTLVDFIDNGVTIRVNVKDMACGSKHSAVLLEDNSVWSSGNNKYGQLGLSIEEHPAVYHFKKCFLFNFASEILCGQWSTVVNVMIP